MNNIMTKLDKVLAFTVGIYSLLVIFHYYGLFVSLGAITNFITATFPFAYSIVFFKSKFERKKFFLMVLIFSLYLLSIIVNLKSLSGYEFINNLYYLVLFVVSYIGIFFHIIPHIKENRDKDIFKYFCLTILFVSFVFCIFNLIKNVGNFGGLLTSTDTYDFRFLSFFGNRNNFGKLLFIANLILYFSYQHKYINKIVFCFLILLINFNLLISFSRGALICTIIFYIINFMKNKKGFLILVLLVIVCFFVVMFNENIDHIVTNLIVRKDNGLTGRPFIWSNAIDLIIQKPYFGYTNSISSSLIYELANNYYFHNSFLKIMCSNGIIYSVLIIYLILIGILPIFKIKKCSEKFLLLGMIVSILVYSFVEEFIFFGTGFIDFLYSFLLFCFIPILIYKNITINIEKES